MVIVVRLGASSLHQWHVSLIERLAEIDGAKPRVEIVDGGENAAGSALLAFEGLLRGQPARGLLSSAPRDNFRPWEGETSDEGSRLTLDLAGAAPLPSGRVWRLAVDGDAVEPGLVSAALEGRTPTATIIEGDSIIAAARLGTDRGDVAALVVEDMLDRVITLITAALRGSRLTLPNLPNQEAEPAGRRISQGWAAGRIAMSIARGAASALYRKFHRSPHWRVGWRKLQGPDLFALGGHPEGGWRDLPDDGTRFYADPFPFLHEGKVTLFVEDFVHDVGRGIISAVTFGENGPIGKPEPVLELPEHLSYPFVFARDGEIWMIPECCESRRVDLWRATAFPGGWVREATLLDNIVASDATLVEHGGLWWMFATVRDGGGFSDALHLWSAPDFRGPWTPHARNPVLIDIASARPAGRMIHRDGALLRPVQDCRKGYGRALGLARVLRLDLDGYEQRVEAIVEAGGPQFPGRRIHTLNSAGGLEFVDGSATVRRSLPWASWRR